jgi:hypothetical protein
VQTFQAAGIAPLLGKGWAIARLYPEEALRPYSDFDLGVPPAAAGGAAGLAEGLARRGCVVDVHAPFDDLDDRPYEEIEARAERVDVHGVTVRVLGPEDHLRLLALHMLGHGAFRPLWLVDVAVLIEARGPHLDWAWLLRGRERRTDWLRAAIHVARELLGASLDGVPPSIAKFDLPRWVRDAVLEAWGHLDPDSSQGSRTPMAHHLRTRTDLLRALRVRWPSALEASLGLEAPLRGVPRWSVQVGECVRRAARFARKGRG